VSGRRTELLPGGAALLQRLFTRLGCEGRPPRFRVEFYPYANLVLTILRREDTILVRISDLLRVAPRAVLEGGAALLLARLYRRKAPAALIARYAAYVRSHRTRQRLNRMRRRRVATSAENPRGTVHDLTEVFDALNRRYFERRLERPHLGWSRRMWRRQLGCYDPGPNQIVLNRRLDRPRVPGYAVEYLLFHEMLHVKHPTRRSGCSLISHSREFREEEKRFAEYARARQFLNRLG